MFVRLLAIFFMMPLTVYSSEFCVPPFFKKVALENSVPSDVVYALALQESGVKMNNGKFMPWPYSANYAGETFLYRDYREMVNSVYKKVSKGKTAVDVGFFQVNWKWHKHRAKSLGHMSHPVINAQISMDILKEQYGLFGDWVVAAGRYHNPFNNEGKADIYAGRYLKWLERVRNGYGC